MALINWRDKMDINCPVCGTNIDLDNYDMPDKACDNMDITCENESCEEEFMVGWYATAEIR